MFNQIKKSSNNVNNKLQGNLKAQEYYWASLKKLTLVTYNKQLILKTPKSFENTGMVENGFNGMVLMSRACLDSLFCAINLVYGDKLEEREVRPLENKFLNTVHHQKIKDILLKCKNKWLDVNGYRDLIIHRSAVMVIPSGSNPEGPSPIKYFGIVKDPSTFILNITSPNMLDKMILRIERKIDAIEKLTEDTFLKISEAFS